MDARAPIFVIDPNRFRREHILRDLVGSSSRRQGFDSVSEFSEAAPELGAVFAADDPCVSLTRRLIDAMRRTGHVLPVALYSEQPAISQVVRGLLHGASDYLEWPFDFKLLRRTIERFVQQEPGTFDERRLKVDATRKIASLTPQEGEVLALLVQGYSNKGMARQLGVCHRTVEIRRGNMLRKLKAQSASDAVRLALWADWQLSLDPMLKRGA